MQEIASLQRMNIENVDPGLISQFEDRTERYVEKVQIQKIGPLSALPTV